MTKHEHDEVIPKPEQRTALDDTIAAAVRGDGFTLNQRRDDIGAWLIELRKYRASIRCEVCGRTVIGREPVCGPCHVEVQP